MSSPTIRGLLGASLLLLGWMGGTPACAGCIDYADYLHWVGSVGTPYDAHGVAMSGMHAFVADGYSGVQVVDISNPRSPRIVSSLDTPFFAYAVTISGDVAYVADGNTGLLVLDVAEPESPRLLGSVDTGDARRVPSLGSASLS